MKLERFAFSSNAYTRHSLQYALNHIAAAGFKGAEILADKPHAWLDAFTAADQTRLVKQLSKLGLFVSNINANCTVGFWSHPPPGPCFEPSFISRQRELREWRIAYSKKALRLGKALGARNVSITSGRALNGVPPEKAQKLLVEGLKRLIEYAEKLEQPFSLSAEPPLLIENTAELAALIKTLGSRYFGANLDVGHEANPAAAIRALKGHLFHVHLEDIRAHKHYHRIPGEGDLNFPAIFKALAQSAYDGPLTWNLYTHDEDPDTACKKSLRYSQTAIRKI